MIHQSLSFCDIFFILSLCENQFKILLMRLMPFCLFLFSYDTDQYELHPMPVMCRYAIYAKII